MTTNPYNPIDPDQYVADRQAALKTDRERFTDAQRILDDQPYPARVLLQNRLVMIIQAKENLELRTELLERLEDLRRAEQNRAKLIQQTEQHLRADYAITPDLLRVLSDVDLYDRLSWFDPIDGPPDESGDRPRWDSTNWGAVQDTPDAEAEPTPGWPPQGT